MRFLICLFILIHTLPSQSQEATYCVTSLSELTNVVKKKSKPMLYYPEFGKLGLYLTVKFGKSTYYLETKYANIEYDTKKKTLTAVCSGTRNCILSGKLTTPNRQPKKELATLSRASARDLQCYTGYLNQQIRRLKYSKPTANLSVNKKKTSPYKTSEKKTESPQKTTKEQEKLLTALGDKVMTNLDHEIALQKFKSKAINDISNCINTVSQIIDTYSKKAKLGDKSSFRRLYVSTQPLEEKAKQYARAVMQHIKDGRNYAFKHKVQKDKWDRLDLDAGLYLGSHVEKGKVVTQAKVDKMNDQLFSILLRFQITQLEALVKQAEAFAKKLK